MFLFIFITICSVFGEFDDKVPRRVLRTSIRYYSKISGQVSSRVLRTSFPVTFTSFSIGAGAIHVSGYSHLKPKLMHYFHASILGVPEVITAINSAFFSLNANAHPAKVAPVVNTSSTIKYLL